MDDFGIVYIYSLGADNFDSVACMVRTTSRRAAVGRVCVEGLKGTSV